MRAVLVQVPEAMLEERRQLGLDVFDEMWEGELHMVPPPSQWHQAVGAELIIFLGPHARRRGLAMRYETGLFDRDRPQTSWRIPDLLVAQADQLDERGARGGLPLVVELLSPGDETYAKFAFYAAQGVAELLVIDPDSRHVELYALRSGRYVAVQPDDEGWLRLSALGARVRTVDGPALEVVAEGERLQL